MNTHLSKNTRYGKGVSLLLVTAAYLLALAVTYFAYPAVAEFGYGPIYTIFILDVIATIIIWLCGLPFANASFYDPFWSVAPVPIALYWWSLSDYEMTIGALLMIIVLFTWAVRLTSNWVRDWPGLVHEDWRYQNLRAQNGKAYQLVNLFGICLFPTALVFLGMLPVYAVLSSPTSSNLFLDSIAAGLGLFAVWLQFSSDEEMRRFRRKPKGNDEVMTSGWWAWSRHPNYFGEVLMWFSLWIFALAAGGLSYAWTGVGALAMFLLFWFVSIPMMDKRCAEKRPAYADYMRRSSGFFLVPPRRGAGNTDG